MQEFSLESREKQIKSVRSSYLAYLTWEGVRALGRALLHINQPPEVITFMRKWNSHVITF